MLFVSKEKKNEQKSAESGMTKMSVIDKMDIKIIEMLEEDGRRSFTEIARKFNVSESTIRKRILVMQRKGVIKKFTVKVDPSTLGINTVAIVGLEVDPTRLLGISEKLCDFAEIKCVATSTGDHMIMTEIWARNGRELTKLISDKIGTIEGVKRICPAIILEKLKD
jgi:Lrp/AsnC family transcriptional regulator for asnA, asnC and gidA